MSGIAAAGAADVARPGIVGARVLRREESPAADRPGRLCRRPQGSTERSTSPFCRSDRAHARIGRIDAAEARQAPGVLGVFTAGDIDAVARPIRATSNMPDYRATELEAAGARQGAFTSASPLWRSWRRNRYLAEDAGRPGLGGLRPAARGDGSGSGARRSRPAPRIGGHQRHRGAGVCPGRRRRGHWRGAAVVVEDRFRIRRKTPFGDREPQLSGRVRGRAAGADPARIDPGARPAARCAGRNIRPAGSPPAGRGRRMSAAVSAPRPRSIRRRSSSVRSRFGSAARSKWTSDRMEDLTATSQAFDEIVPRETGAGTGRPVRGSGCRCDRRCRRLLDLSLDGVARTGAGGQLPAGALPASRTTAAGSGAVADLEGADGGRIAASAGRFRPSSWNGWSTWPQRSWPWTRPNSGRGTWCATTSFLTSPAPESSGTAPVFRTASGRRWTGSAMRSGGPNRRRRATRADWSASGSRPTPS